tara:strand:+ start:2379 stop:2957 length:579 start_codon:yes stop_codon:yes gene_type:complete
MRSYKVITAAASNVLTTAEVKSHLKVDTTADDTLIDNLIIAATNSCQEYTNRFFITTEITQYGDNWSDVSELFKSPVQTTLFNIKYWDTTGTLQSLATTKYTLDNVSQPARLAPAPDESWPSIIDGLNAIEVNYKVGVDNAADVDNAIKQALLLTIGHWYQNREAVIVGRQVNEMPMSAKYLLDQYKIQVIR